MTFVRTCFHCKLTNQFCKKSPRGEQGGDFSYVEFIAFDVVIPDIFLYILKQCCSIQCFPFIAISCFLWIAPANKTGQDRPELQTHYRLNSTGVCQLQADLRGRGLFMLATSSHISLPPNCSEWRLCPAHPSSSNLTSLPSALQAGLEMKKLRNGSRNPKYQWL